MQALPQHPAVPSHRTRPTQSLTVPTSNTALAPPATAPLDVDVAARMGGPLSHAAAAPAGPAEQQPTGVAVPPAPPPATDVWHAADSFAAAATAAACVLSLVLLGFLLWLGATWRRRACMGYEKRWSRAMEACMAGEAGARPRRRQDSNSDALLVATCSVSRDGIVLHNDEVSLALQLPRPCHIHTHAWAHSEVFVCSECLGWVCGR